MTPARASTASPRYGPIGGDRLGVAWLDGRAQGMAGHDHAGVHAGAMQLRANAFDMDLGRGSDAVVDAATCDCCQTDVAMTDPRSLVVYRRRRKLGDIGEGFEGGRWTSPRPCMQMARSAPARSTARRSRRGAIKVVVAWYSEAGGTPAVLGAQHRCRGSLRRAGGRPGRRGHRPGRRRPRRRPGMGGLAARGDATGQTLMLAATPDLSKPLQRIEVAAGGLRAMPPAARGWSPTAAARGWCGPMSPTAWRTCRARSWCGERAYFPCAS